jgi:lipopolysaccharide biosynthesis regulator YciM
VCYGELGQKDKQREALVNASRVNDHFVPALVNLAHMEMKANHLNAAVTLLNKAATADPIRVEAISLLAQAEFAQGHYDAAIADARKAHQLPHQRFAIVHYTAASAFEKENSIPDAIAELQVFLQEEPQGARSDVVRKVLATMQGQVQTQSKPRNPPH